MLPLLVLISVAAFLPVSEIAQVGRQLADTIASTRRLQVVHAEPVLITDGRRDPRRRAAARPFGSSMCASPIPAGSARAGGRVVRRAGRRNGGAGRPVRRRQDDHRQLAAALLGPGAGRDPAGWHRSARPDAGRAARPHRAGGAGHLSVQRHAGGECAARAARCDARADETALRRPRWRSSSPAAGRVGDPRGRARRAAFRRAAAAHRHRAGVPEGCAAAGPGRGDLASRYDQRTGGARGAGCADGGPHDDRGCAPAVDDPGGRSDPGAARGPGDRVRYA